MDTRKQRLPLVRSLAWVLLVGPAWGQGPPAPVIREAFAEQRPEGGDLLPSARLRSYLELVVCKADYDTWAQAQNPLPQLALYLDGGMATPAMDLLLMDRDPRSDTEIKADAQAQRVRQQCPGGATYVLSFYLDPQFLAGNDTKNAWLQLLQRPWVEGNVGVSAGPVSGVWLSAAQIPFERINWLGFGLWAAVFVVAIILFIRYARDSDIIRDTGTLSDADARAGLKKTFSLARTQMAVWTFIVAGALAFIFLVTWNENTITSGVLILIGISSGTTVLAATTDGSHPVQQATSGHFLTDLLTDGDGPSFHRYQMLLFTVVLVVIFVIKTASNLVMPDFDPTLLGLMGISNGTYLGFKLQDR